MQHRRNRAVWLGLVVSLFWADWANLGTADAQAPANRPKDTQPSTNDAGAASDVPVNELPAGVREGVRRVLEKPTLAVQGPTEVFIGRPAMYHWLLEHPDRAARMWRRLGAKCLEICPRKGGAFGWADGQGTDIHWTVICRTPRKLIWYAEGSASPGPIVPSVPIHAVVVLHFAEGPDEAGHTIIHQRADLYLLTDSTAAALVAKMFGPSASQLAEQCVAQLEMFFSALVWYLDRHPDRETLLLGSVPPELAPPVRADRSPAGEWVR